MAMLPEDRANLEALKDAIGFEYPFGCHMPKEPMSVDPAYDEIALYYADHFPTDWKTPFFVFVADIHECPYEDVVEANWEKFEDIPGEGPVPHNVCTRLSDPKPAWH
ncbi:MAG: hypothetical protein AAFX96_06230 [Pseudomonadota bacterium]